MNTSTKIEDSKLTSVRKFWLMWSGQLLSILGSEIVGFAVIWWITGLNTSTQMVTLSYLLLLIPQILLSPLAGFLTDRFNRKIIMIVADISQAIVTVLIILLLQFGGIGILGIIILNAVRSIGGVFHRNALQDSTAQIVPKDKLSQINSLKFLTEFGVKIIGSLLAALVVELWTLQIIMWIDVATWLIASIFLFGIKIPTLIREVRVETDKKTHRLRTFTDDYKESFQIIRKIPVIFSLMIISLFTNVVLQPLNVLLLLFIRNDHGGTAMTFSIIGVVSQIGMLCGALVMSAKKEWKKGGYWMIGGCFVIFFGIVLLKLIPLGTFWLLSVTFFVMFFFLPIINTIYLTYVQRTTPKEAHGRIFSIDSTISAIGAPIGVLLSGYFGDLVGIGFTFFGAGLLGLIVIILSSIFGQVHTIKIINQPEEVHPPEVINPPTNTAA